MVAAEEQTMQIVSYSVTDAMITEMGNKYRFLKVMDSESYETVRLAIADVRTKRTDIEKRRKELKEDALKWGRLVDSEAKRITTLLLAIEEPLQAEKKKEDDRKAAIKEAKEAKERARIDAIRAKISAIQRVPILLVGKSHDEILTEMDGVFAIDIDSSFAEFEPEAMRVKDETLATIKKAYDAAVESERKAEELEKQRKEQEIERQRIVEENRKLNEEKAKIEAEKKAEHTRKDLEALQHRLKEQAEADAKAKVEREAKEKKDKEEAEEKERLRKAAQAPDKEKLLSFAGTLENIQPMQVDSDKAFTILSDALRGIRGIVAMVKKGAEGL